MTLLKSLRVAQSLPSLIPSELRILLCEEVNVLHAPGYRDVTVTCRVRVNDRVDTLDLLIPAIQALRLAEYIANANRTSWRGGDRPLDAMPDEKPADWPWRDSAERSS